MPQYVNETHNVTTGAVEREVIPWTAETLAAYLAEVRYNREVSGITVDGFPIDTSRGNERTVWQNLMIQAKADPNFTINKKLSGRFYRLTAAQVLRCAGLGARYIGACFETEAAFLTQIEAATTDEALESIAAEIDQATSWPARTYSPTPNALSILI